MAPLARPRSQSPSDDEDVPEAITLSQSKINAKRLEAERQSAVAAGRQIQKEKNRALDRKLKERAQKTKGNVAGRPKGSATGATKKDSAGSDSDGPEDDEDRDGGELEVRMRRAMQEADQEDNNTDDEDRDEDEGPVFEGASDFVDTDDDEHDGEDGETDEEADEDKSFGSEEDTDEDEDGEEEEKQGPSRTQKNRLNPDHLPDELFAAAFKSNSTNSQSKRKAEEDVAISSPMPKKRKRSKAKAPRDVIIGSRAIRVLPNSQAPATPSALPSRKIKKFLDRTLAFKDGKQALRTRGWERKPANVGVLRRDGPALGFVRNR